MAVTTDTGDKVSISPLGRGDMTLSIRDSDGEPASSITLWPHEAEALRDKLDEAIAQCRRIIDGD